MELKTKTINRCGCKAAAVFMLFSLLLISPACKKFVEIDSVTDKLLASQVYTSDATSNSAIAGIYRQFKTNLQDPIFIYNSLASDDIVNYSPSVTFDPYSTNTLLSNDPRLAWANLYNIVYATNSAIEGLSAGKGTSESARQYYLGEAKFNRALAYFYLVNWFGDVPLVLTTDVSVSATASRTPAAQVYTQIIADLKDAQAALGDDYSYTGGDRSRANKWVATALLARVYLYQKDWVNAKLQADAVINSGLYSLLDGPTGIFEQNNAEAILQWSNYSSESNFSAGNFIFNTTPNLICRDNLLNAFEPGDLRKTTWIASKAYNGATYYYPYKFTTTSPNTTEWFVVLRLAEQYLIRAEANAMQNDFTDAVADINLIRLKHGGLTTALPVPADQKTCMDLIMNQRQVDLFTEGCHRWFDLKRTGRIDAVMTAEKPATWQSSSALYPIPLGDILKDPNLKQNPGYQ